MASLTKDDLWKVFSLLMSVLVLPLAGWVWNTNIKVAELQKKMMKETNTGNTVMGNGIEEIGSTYTTKKKNSDTKRMMASMYR